MENTEVKNEPIKSGGGVGFSAPLEQKTNRDSGIELFRIITMLLIVAHHYVVNSGLLSFINADPLSGNSLFLLLFGAWGKTGINCFVLITGYFMCKSNITLKKFLKLLLEIEFYKIVFYFIFLITGYEPFSLKGLVKAFLPIYNVGTGFTSCYLLFFLFIPFLNILIQNMNKQQHLLLIALCSFVYIIIGTVPKFSVTMNYVSWFIVLYFIASFVRIYPIALFSNRKIWGILAVSVFIVSALSVVCCAWLGTKLNQDGFAFYFVADSNKILAVATAFCAFMFFKNVHFECKFINKVASAAFGVLLIHANSDTMRRWLWGDLLNNVGQFTSKLGKLAIHAIGSVLAIYIVCTVIDLIRIYLIERPFFKVLDKKLFHKKQD
ncbi:MAG: acyltransferase family protein [Clostridia bacterium]|nr:acyltransferase family protein [Clostridia bacterium]